MKMSNLRIKRTKKVIPPPRTSFAWTEKVQVRMAEYVRNNYSIYKKIPGISFVRLMMSSLNVGANENATKAALARLINGYKRAKQQEDQTGFGVDKRTCPYYDILDEVMGMGTQIIVPQVIIKQEDVDVDIDIDCSPFPVLENQSYQSSYPEVEDQLLLDAETDQQKEESEETSTNKIKIRKRHNSVEDESPFLHFTKYMKKFDKETELNKQKLDKEIELSRQKLEWEKEQAEKRFHLTLEKMHHERELELAKMQHELNLKDKEIEYMKLKIQYAKIVTSNPVPVPDPDNIYHDDV